MDIFIKAVQLILSLSILVILHEFGHFFFARVFNTRVEKFYLFFNPGFTLFKYKKGETEYGVGWLPLGGYVKISGMIDESMDKEAMAQPPKPWEFRSKPAWQRLFIMIGGVLVNFILAFFIFWMVLYTWGESYNPVQSAKYGLTFNDKAKELGLQDGDIVIKVGDLEVETTGEITKAVLLENARQMTLLRNGQTITLPIPEGFDLQMMADGIQGFCEIRYPAVLAGIAKGSAADSVGLTARDSIVSVNGESLIFYNDFSKAVQANAGNKIDIGLIRDGELLTLSPIISDKGTVGVYASLEGVVDVKVHKYTLMQALPRGIQKGFNTLTDYIKQFRLVFTKEGAKQVGGFGAMGKMFPSEWSWLIFWYNTALISLILAFMNILPIPALDGGHVMFLLYEMVTGRKPGDKFLEYAQVVGMVMLLSLLLFANGNDIFKAIFN